MKGKYLLFLLWISLCCHPVYAFNWRINPTMTSNISSLSRPMQDSLIQEPMYNLYYLSKVLSRKQDNLKALGYLNHLFEKSKYTEEDKTYLLSFVDTAFVRNDLRIKVRDYLLELHGKDISDNLIIEKYGVKGVFNDMDMDKNLEKKILGINAKLYPFRNTSIVNRYNAVIDSINIVLEELLIDNSTTDKEIIERYNLVKVGDSEFNKGINTILEGNDASSKINWDLKDLINSIDKDTTLNSATKIRFINTVIRKANLSIDNNKISQLANIGQFDQFINAYKIFPFTRTNGIRLLIEKYKCFKSLDSVLRAKKLLPLSISSMIIDTIKNDIDVINLRNYCDSIDIKNIKNYEALKSMHGAKDESLTRINNQIINLNQVVLARKRIKEILKLDSLQIKSLCKDLDELQSTVRNRELLASGPYAMKDSLNKAISLDRGSFVNDLKSDSNLELRSRLLFFKDKEAIHKNIDGSRSVNESVLKNETLRSNIVKRINDDIDDREIESIKVLTPEVLKSSFKKIIDNIRFLKRIDSLNTIVDIISFSDLINNQFKDSLEVVVKDLLLAEALCVFPNLNVSKKVDWNKLEFDFGETLKNTQKTTVNIGALGREIDKFINENVVSNELYNNYITSYLEVYQKERANRNHLIDSAINIYLSKSVSAKNEKGDKINAETKIGQQQVLMAQIVVENEQQRASGFKLPSESDAIMALAQFMANRAKQETMIWFAETLKDRMQDQLIWDMFPNAKSIIDEYDPNSVPDFNEIWRTSLAKDFVGMPNNLLNGEWIQQKSKKIGRENQLEDAKKVLLVYNQFNKYIGEKSNYSAVIENLYDLVNQRGFVSNNDNLKKAINLIYITANEFYTVHNNSLSYVDFNQIKELNTTEWEVLLRLIKVKYGNDTYKSFSEIIKFKNENIDDIYSLFKGPKEKKVLSESIISIIDKRKLLLTDDKREKLDSFINLIKGDNANLVYGLFAKESLKTIFNTKLHKTDVANDLTDAIAQKLTDNLVSRIPQNLKGIDMLANTLATDTSITNLFKDYFTKEQNDSLYKVTKIKEIISFGINNISIGNIDSSIFSAMKTIKVENGDQAIKMFKEVYSTLYETPNSAKVGNILNALSRLQTLSKAANSDVSFSLIWNNMIDLLKFVDPDYEVIKDNFNASKYKEIGQLQNLHKLYVHLNKKEFKLAFKTAIEIAEPFYSINDFKVEIIPNDKGISLALEGNVIKKKKKGGNTDKTILSFMIPNNKVFKYNSLVDASVQIQFDSQLSTLKVIKKDSFVYNLDDLKNEFRKVRYGYKDELVNREAIQSILKDNVVINQFVNTLFQSKDTTQDYNRLRLSNLIVDVYTDPKAIFTKNFYKEYNLNEQIQYSQLSDNSMNQFAKLSIAFADMMTARDDNDLYKVIENISAPRESYRLKRINKHSFSLNGYVGAYAGYQDVFSMPSDFRSSFIYGVTAPIGFTYSQKKWGVFLQGIELGNVVNHYLWNTTDKIDKQKVSFKEVFSPGLSFMYNIPKSPFVAFVGCKLVQLDTRYDESQDIYINSKYFDIVQYTMGVKVDIPFFTFGKNKF